MKILKNQEVKKAFLAFLLVTVVFTTVGVYCIDVLTGVLILTTCICMCGVFFFTTKNRYEKIAQLSNIIDEILHNENILAFGKNDEGELAILESEIYKMTVRLREQTYALKNDKIYLTDSIANISHQLRTPLTTINLLMSFLQKRDLNNTDRMKYAKDINQSLARIDWLITSLLKISKLDADTVGFKKEKVMLSELISKSVEPLIVPMELRNQLFDYSSKGYESFQGDVNWSIEAIGNIIKNCMEHTPKDGHISVKGEENPLYTEIIVEDTGPGVNVEDMPHIFERFYKGKDSGQSGVGIGLALSKMIIQKQNGSVKIENKSENGARFIIRFYKNNC